MIRTYSDLKKLKTFEDRFDYLKLKGVVGQSTFGYDRYINQILYTSKRWRNTRDDVIIRDNGCDLGIDGFEINDIIVIHHMNVLTLEDIENDIDELYDPEFLISTSFRTHNGIHYGDAKFIGSYLPKVRTPGDTTPWKNSQNRR